MLGDPGQMMSSSGGGGTTEAAESAAAAAASNSGGSSGAGALPGGFGEESERNSGGNRWPRQETLALLKIRSDMDAVFRDSSLKGPLWEEVSRKMAELGYHRSSKKCKEKFENVFKYHKRTKDGRAAKSDGKTYRFFDQLEAFHASSTPSQAAAAPISTAVSPMVVTAPAGNPPRPVAAALPQFTVSSGQNTGSAFPAPLRAVFAPIPVAAAKNAGIALSYSTSSSTSSDEDIQRRHRKKRKWKEFFERVMAGVIVKQEEMQRKFLEALEKRERDRTVREDAWRAQETARIKRERDILLQERSMAAAKDAAVINLLQKLSDQNNNVQIPSISNNSLNSDPIIQIQVQIPETLSTPPLAPPPEPSPISVAPPASMPFSIQTPTPEKTAAGESSPAPPSSSRWPKAEVQALIDLRSSLDVKYQENGPKGPLWEEISAAMRRLGYNRNPKRCKEKWENINKYFKKVKESNKKRPEDSKTCPYFHQLEALYSNKKAKLDIKPESNPNTARPELANGDDNDDDDGDYDDAAAFGGGGGGGGYEIAASMQYSLAQQATQDEEEEERK